MQGTTSDLASRLRQALQLEHARIDHYLKAIECAHDPRLQAEWHEVVEIARQRVIALESQLRQAMREVTRPAADGHDAPRPHACLIGAMDLALRNGDRPAAQVVARECIALAEAHVANTRARAVAEDAALG